jgi:hypothetical protein
MGSADRSGRHALWGAIFGALIGGLFSFVGIYATAQTQSQKDHEELKRASYVKLISEADRYRMTLHDLEAAAVSGDQKVYDKASAAQRAGATALYSASSEASLLAGEDELQAIYKVTNEAFKFDARNKYQDLDTKSVRASMDGTATATKELAAQGRNIFGEDPNFLESILP